MYHTLYLLPNIAYLSPTSRPLFVRHNEAGSNCRYRDKPYAENRVVINYLPTTFATFLVLVTRPLQETSHTQEYALALIRFGRGGAVIENDG